MDGSLGAEAILSHVESLALRIKSDIFPLHVEEISDLMLDREEVVDVDGFLGGRRKHIKKNQLNLQAIAERWRASPSPPR